MPKIALLISLIIVLTACSSVSVDDDAISTPSPSGLSINKTSAIIQNTTKPLVLPSPKVTTPEKTVEPKSTQEIPKLIFTVNDKPVFTPSDVLSDIDIPLFLSYPSVLKKLGTPTRLGFSRGFRISYENGNTYSFFTRGDQDYNESPQYGDWEVYSVEGHSPKTKGPRGLCVGMLYQDAVALFACYYEDNVIEGSKFNEIIIYDAGQQFKASNAYPYIFPYAKTEISLMEKSEGSYNLEQAILYVIGEKTNIENQLSDDYSSEGEACYVMRIYITDGIVESFTYVYDPASN